jgi:hypothetical protein
MARFVIRLPFVIFSLENAAASRLAKVTRKDAAREPK